jgi:hypothetical protein
MTASTSAPGGVLPSAYPLAATTASESAFSAPTGATNVRSAMPSLTNGARQRLCSPQGTSGGNGQQQRYVTLPTIPPISILVPNDSKLAEKLGEVPQPKENAQRQRADPAQRVAVPSTPASPSQPSVAQFVPQAQMPNVSQPFTLTTSAGIPLFFGISPNQSASPLAFTSVLPNAAGMSFVSPPTSMGMPQSTVAISNEHLLASLIPQNITPSQLIQFAQQQQQLGPLLSLQHLQVATPAESNHPLVMQQYMPAVTTTNSLYGLMNFQAATTAQPTMVPIPTASIMSVAEMPNALSVTTNASPSLAAQTQLFQAQQQFLMEQIHQQQQMSAINANAQSKHSPSPVMPYMLPAATSESAGMTTTMPLDSQKHLQLQHYLSQFPNPFALMGSPATHHSASTIAACRND